MRLPRCGIALVVLAMSSASSAVYLPLREYSGSTFFDGWDYWGNVDNTTWGNVTYLDQQAAATQRLTYVNDAGHAIVKVDNTTNIAPAALVNRPSIRLTSKDSYGEGTLWIIDAIHMPYGCSVWPSFWTLGTGKEWPHAGEIDIIEGINLQNNNQYALHADAGCAQAANPLQSGRTLEGDCSLDRGCIVAETKTGSYGRGFAEAGGGVYAVQMDVAGVFIWFWSRPDVPEIIRTATSTTNMDVAAFGVPSAAYPASGCNITQYFGPQQLVLLITLCGSWAGVPSIYSSTCPGQCIDNVFGPGSPTYDNAYWEIPYIRTYVLDDLAPSLPPPSSSEPPSSSSDPVSTATSQGEVSPTPTGRTNTGGNGAMRVGEGVLGVVAAVLGAAYVLLSLI